MCGLDRETKKRKREKGKKQSSIRTTVRTRILTLFELPGYGILNRSLAQNSNSISENQNSKIKL